MEASQGNVLSPSRPNSIMIIGQVDLFGSQMQNNDLYLQTTFEIQETHVLEISSKQVNIEIINAWKRMWKYDLTAFKTIFWVYSIKKILKA